jgi:hypothetical protein
VKIGFRQKHEKSCAGARTALFSGVSFGLSLPAGLLLANTPEVL